MSIFYFLCFSYDFYIKVLNIIKAGFHRSWLNIICSTEFILFTVINVFHRGPYVIVFMLCLMVLWGWSVISDCSIFC